MREQILRLLSQARKKHWLPSTKWYWHGCPAILMSRLCSGTSAKSKLQCGQLHCDLPGSNPSTKLLGIPVKDTIFIHSCKNLLHDSGMQIYTWWDQREHAEQLELLASINGKLWSCFSACCHWLTAPTLALAWQPNGWISPLQCCATILSCSLRRSAILRCSLFSKDLSKFEHKPWPLASARWLQYSLRCSVRGL